MRSGGPRRLSCGVLVTDGAFVLLGHATRSPRWDIPKGLLDPGETEEEAARRELLEETGLHAGPLHPLGRHPYLRDKDLALFAWRPRPMPDPAALRCAALVHPPRGAPFPEFDGFGLFRWDDALARVGKSMAALLATIRPQLDPGAPPGH